MKALVETIVASTVCVCLWSDRMCPLFPPLPLHNAGIGWKLQQSSWNMKQMFTLYYCMISRNNELEVLMNWLKFKIILTHLCHVIQISLTNEMSCKYYQIKQKFPPSSKLRNSVNNINYSALYYCLTCESFNINKRIKKYSLGHTHWCIQMNAILQLVAHHKHSGCKSSHYVRKNEQ